MLDSAFKSDPAIGAICVDINQEKELVKQAQKSPVAFGHLYDQYFKQIFNYVVHRTGDIGVAQDITSETFFKALTNLWRFQWRNIPFSAWLYKIATNEIRLYYRKGRYNAVSLDELIETGNSVPASTNDLEAEYIEAQDALHRHEEFLFYRQKISELPINYQEVIVLRFFEEKQIKEISQILGKSEGTVKSLLHRGLEKLRKNHHQERQTCNLLETEALYVQEGR
jgi:RNA polymerase sigma-70 factor (ECF subfamily)